MTPSQETLLQASHHYSTPHPSSPVARPTPSRCTSSATQSPIRWLPSRKAPTSHDLLLDRILDATDFLPLLRSPHCISAAVAMSHKVSITSEVDALIKGAHVIGAINTIVMHLDERGGRRYIGANTDC